MRVVALALLVATTVVACGNKPPGVDAGGVDADPVDSASGMLDAPIDTIDATPTDAGADAMAMADAGADAMAMADAGADAMAPADAAADAAMTTPDAAAPDAAPADADTSGRGQVSVVIVDKNGVPIPGLRVVFIDTDATVTDVTTNAAGTASANVFTGASVTAVRARQCADPNLCDYSLTTVQAIEPGDIVTLISAPGSVSSTQDPFTLRTVPLPSADIALATKSGNTATYTTVAPHGLAVNDRVVVSGVTNPGYNGSFVITAATTTTFSVSFSGGLQDSTGGIAYEALPYTFMYSAYPGATSYEVHTPCGPTDVGNTTTAQVVLRAGCVRSPMDVLVFAKTSASVEAAYIQATNLTFTAGGTSLITDTWHALPTVTATYTNPTARVTDVGVERFTPYQRGLAPVAASGTTSGGPVSLMLTAATPALATMRTLLSCDSGASTSCISNAKGAAFQTISQGISGATTSYALDLGATLLPWVSASYLPTSTTLDVTVTGAGSYDLFEADLRYIRGQSIYTWRVFGPTAIDISFPTLPSTLPGDPTVRTTDTQSAYHVYLCESDAIASYRAAIANPYLALATCESPASVGAIPSAGTLNRFSQSN